MSKRKTQRKSSKRRQVYRRAPNFSQALKRLKKLKSNEQRKALSMANDTFIRHLCKELKMLRHAKLTTKKRRALQKHKKNLRHLVNNRTTMTKRRQILTQKGGGILKGILSAIPLVGTVLDLVNNV